MGNCQAESCPTHPHNHITQICLCESCLQPLCDECVGRHDSIHAKLGYPSQMQSYAKVKSEYTDSDIKMKGVGDRVADNLAPTSLLIKSFTREYFNKLSNDAKSAKLLSNLEIWNQVKEDPEIKKKIADFLKANLQVNGEIVGRKFIKYY